MMFSSEIFFLVSFSIPLQSKLINRRMGNFNTQSTDPDINLSSTNFHITIPQQPSDQYSQKIIFSPKSSLALHQIDLIREQCKKISFISDLPPSNIQAFVSKFIKCFSSDQWLFKEGSEPKYFFIIATGKIEIIKNGFLIRTLGPGQFFGEMALLYGIKRSSSVRVVKDFKVKNSYYALHRKHFLEAIQYLNSEKVTEFLSIIEHNPFFSYTTIRDKIRLAQTAVKINFKQDQRILTKFDEPYALFIIISGKVLLKFPNKRQMQLEKNEIFGYFGNQGIQYSATSMNDSVVYTIGKDNLKKILGKRLIYLYLWKKTEYILLNSQLLFSYSKKKVQMISNSFCFRFNTEFKKLKKNVEPLTNIYIAITCKVNGTHSNSVIGLAEALSSNHFYQIDHFIESGYYGIIRVDNLKQCLQLEEEEQIQQLSWEKGKKVGKFKNNELMLQQKFNLEYIYEQKSFKQDNFCFQLEERLRNLYNYLNLNYVQSIYSIKYQKREKKLILVREFVKGISLKQLASKYGTLNLNLSKFYISSMILILSFLYQKCICFESFSLESCKVDEDGFMWLTGSPLQLLIAEIEESQKIQSQLCISRQKKIQTMMRRDIEKLASISFYLLTGYNLQICNQKIMYPDSFKNKEAKQMIDKLLSLSKDQFPCLKKIKSLQFFKNINWRNLQTKQMEAPIIPGFLSRNQILKNQNDYF